ncbi:DNA2-like helicase [Platysternon megacephalum]|uniref:DNA2-like helicase n=1 Tax=Platysternon megacephalum TaxID=55544 RepID=A0A4D9EL07_9SAUR|nr:DNA2-like helicase [Platysternon megacephalum]
MGVGGEGERRPLLLPVEKEKKAPHYCACFSGWRGGRSIPATPSEGRGHSGGLEPWYGTLVCSCVSVSPDYLNPALIARAISAVLSLSLIITCVAGVSFRIHASC